MRDARGTLRVLSWNIWLGGRGHGPANRRRVARTLAAARPDVAVVIETYGCAPEIMAALGSDYHAFQITRDQPPGRDNLWIFSRWPPVAVHPAPAGAISGFNCGGVRVAPPSMPECDVIAAWLDYRTQVAPAMESAIDTAAAGGPVDPASLARADERRHPQARALLHTYLPSLAGPERAVILAGDFNTLSHLDWGPDWAGAPGHHGLAVRWPVTAAVADAGFTDAYRAARPDVAEHPGTTWSPLREFRAPYRIDYIFTRGPLTARSAWTIDRDSVGGPGPFCSDHAAVVAELAAAWPAPWRADSAEGDYGGGESPRSS